MAKLTSKQLRELDDSMFGLPSDRSYPMPDKSHVTKAVQFFSYCPDDKKKELAKNINRRARELNMKLFVKGTFMKYIDPDVASYNANESTVVNEASNIGTLSPIVPITTDNTNSFKNIIHGIANNSFKIEPEVDENGELTTMLTVSKEAVDFFETHRAIELTDGEDEEISNIIAMVATQREFEDLKNYTICPYIKRAFTRTFIGPGTVSKTLDELLTLKTNSVERTVSYLLSLPSTDVLKEALLLVFLKCGCEKYFDKYLKIMNEVIKHRNEKTRYVSQDYMHEFTKPKHLPSSQGISDTRLAEIERIGLNGDLYRVFSKLMNDNVVLNGYGYHETVPEIVIDTTRGLSTKWFMNQCYISKKIDGYAIVNGPFQKLIFVTYFDALYYAEIHRHKYKNSAERVSVLDIIRIGDFDTSKLSNGGLNLCGYLHKVEYNIENDIREPISVDFESIVPYAIDPPSKYPKTLDFMDELHKSLDGIYMDTQMQVKLDFRILMTQKNITELIERIDVCNDNERLKYLITDLFLILLNVVKREDVDGDAGTYFPFIPDTSFGFDDEGDNIRADRAFCRSLGKIIWNSLQKIIKTEPKFNFMNFVIHEHFIYDGVIQGYFGKEIDIPMANSLYRRFVLPTRI